MLGHPPVRVGWQADPFGHSNTMAYISALNGFQAHVLGRPMPPLDPITNQSSVVWHPLQSAPPAHGFDRANSVMLYDEDGYWAPYRNVYPSLRYGDLDGAATAMDAYVRAAANRGQRPKNVLVMLGDDAPLQGFWSDVYPQLDSVSALRPCFCRALGVGLLTSRQRYRVPTIFPMHKSLLGKLCLFCGSVHVFGDNLQQELPLAR